MRNGNVYVTIPYAKWFDRLNARAAAKVATAIIRIGQGNFSSTKGIGGGVFEARIDLGPGYRIYFGRDGDLLVILLAGGVKQRQQEDIDRARTFWKDYKLRKSKETKPWR